MSFNTRLAGLLALLVIPAAGAAEEPIFRSGDQIIVRIESLAQLRQQHRRLQARIRLSGTKSDKLLTVDLADRLTPDALVIDVQAFGACTAVALEVQDEGRRVVFARQARPVPVVTLADALPVQAGVFAAIEPGSQLDSAAPRIPLPDPAKLPAHRLTIPARTVALHEITYPVVADADLPGPASQNYVVVSRQSFAPADPTKCSLYFSYRKAIYDDATTHLKEWRKMLVEVPLDRAWLDGSADEDVTLPLDGFAIHTTEEREFGNKRWNAPEGYNMLGGSSSGLYQGGQSAEVDDQGRIYISNVADGAGIVRFNPHTGRFEQPPVNVVAETRQHFPAVADVKFNWDLDDAKLVCARGRLFIVFDRNYKVSTPNGVFETCSGVVSLPLEHWQDADAFRRELRLHAGCWPTAEHPLYDDALAVGGSRRAGSPLATSLGIAFGAFRLDLDAQGRTQRLARIKTLDDAADVAGRTLLPVQVETLQGLPRQRFFNVGAAGRQFVRQAYGEFSISRAALALTMPDAPADLVADSAGRHRSTFPGAPTGELTIRFDVTAKILSDPERFGSLAAATAGISQGPNYAVIAIPDEPGQALAVCDYNYFYSRLDFSRREKDRTVYKSYLKLLSRGRPTSHPASVGLGPYNSTWIEHDDALWLYIPGYTGLSRLKYAEAGRRREAFASEVFHTRLSPQPIDGVGRDGVKDFLHVLPATDGRLINVGRGRVGRGGGARSAGLELFDPRTLGASRTAVEMNRCYGLFTPLSRMIYSASGAAPRQEIYIASGPIRPEYVADIDDPARRPQNPDPKIFAYDCASGGGLRDLYGFALPTAAGESGACHIAFSPCRQFLVVLQEHGRLWTYSLAERRFVAGLQLQSPAGRAMQPLEFAKPSAWIWSAPNGRIFFHTAFDGDAAPSVNFFEVRVTHAGRLSVVPHLAVTRGQAGRVKDFQGVVRCFLPDLAPQDGSYDLVLGGDSDNGGQPTVRVIDDFIQP